MHKQTGLRKKYLGCAGQQTHYRQAGEGEALVMLHASPMSSAQMVPLIEPLSKHFNVIAPDTPGYGNSDPLSPDELSNHQGLEPYTNWLSRFLDELGDSELGGSKPVLYGTATGAQIAIESARCFPDRLSGVVLDNAAHFENDEREQILARYFPSLKPQEDAGHFSTVWEISQNLFQFFPWFEQDEAHRIGQEPAPLAAVHGTALCYLNAGEDYAQAYRRAFYNEDARRVQSLTTPVEVIRWQGSILKKYSDRFDKFDWPEHIRMRHCGPTMGERLEAIRDAVADLF